MCCSLRDKLILWEKRGFVFRPWLHFLTETWVPLTPLLGWSKLVLWTVVQVGFFIFFKFFSQVGVSFVAFIPISQTSQRNRYCVSQSEHKCHRWTLETLLCCYLREKWFLWSFAFLSESTHKLYRGFLSTVFVLTFRCVHVNCTVNRLI